MLVVTDNVLNDFWEYNQLSATAMVVYVWIKRMRTASQGCVWSRGGCPLTPQI